MSLNDASGIKKDLQEIVDMWWKVEFDDWEAKGNPEDHTFHAYNNIKNWLVGQDAEEKEQKTLMVQDKMAERMMQDYEGTLSEIIKQNTNKE